MYIHIHDADIYVGKIDRYWELKLGIYMLIIKILIEMGPSCFQFKFYTYFNKGTIVIHLKNGNHEFSPPSDIQAILTPTVYWMKLSHTKLL